MPWIAESDDIFAVTDSTVEYTGPAPTQSIIFNAYYNTPISTSEENYYEFDIGGGRISVGLCSESSFGPGYKLKGFFYNQNLTNGSSLLQSEFGYPIKDDDKLGMLTYFTGDELNVFFYHNGSCLGQALKAQVDPSTVLYPCVSLRVSGNKVSINSATAPTDRTRMAAPQAFPAGTYKAQGQPVQTIVRLSYHKDDVLNFAMKIANTLSTQLTKAGDDSYTPAGLVRSTRMAGSEEQMAQEQVMSKFMETTQQITSNGSGGVTLINPEQEIVCEAYMETKEPVQSIVF